jgi:enterochelin esterase-like enzyme
MRLKLVSLLAALALAPMAASAQLPPSDQDYVIAPPYVDAPETVANPNVPQGDVRELILYSEDSKIYPGIVRIENEISAKRDKWGNRMPAPAEQVSKPGRYMRHVYVYIPRQYVPGTPTPFMVVQDGRSYIRRLAPVLDNMIAAKRLPAMVIVAADSGGSDAQGSQRGLEYDTISDRYYQWVETELLPRVAKEYNITFTRDPEGRGAMGGSSGAICAWTMAWFHPESYRKVLSYSGTFVNQASPLDPKTPRGGWEYHATLIPKAKKKPIRMWMHVSEQDNHFDDPEESWHNWPMANNRMAAVLKKKGYDYRYVSSKESRHVDPRVVMATLPSALEWLWRDYPK